MKSATTVAVLLLSIYSQTSCLMEVKNYEFKKNEVFRGNHTENPDYKAIMFSESKGTIYSASLTQLSDFDDLWLGESKLDNIEDGALCSSPTIRKITFFRNNNLPELTSGTFKNCTNLNVVVYDRNFVNSSRQFSDDTFAGLSNLKTLAIFGGTKFHHVSRTLFKGLNNLIIFRIVWSNLATIEHGAFDDLVNLETLDLRENKLETLDNELFSKLSNLQELDLSRNNLKKIDTGVLVDLHNLEKLDISRNKLENFPWNDLVGLSKLTKFDFYNNNVRNLTTEVDMVETVKNHWPNLQRLNYQQKTMSCEEVVATTTAIWKFQKYLEMPYYGCKDQWRKYYDL